jgi:hypothetical protein
MLKLLQSPPPRSFADTHRMLRVMTELSPNFLADVPKASALAVLESVALITYREGAAPVFTQGDPSDGYYYILTGSCSVHMHPAFTHGSEDYGTEVAFIRGHAGFGEKTMIEGGVPRTATVIPSDDEPTQLLKVAKVAPQCPSPLPIPLTPPAPSHPPHLCTVQDVFLRHMCNSSLVSGRVQAKIDFLHTCPVFSTHGPSALRNIAYFLRESTHAKVRPRGVWRLGRLMGCRCRMSAVTSLLSHCARGSRMLRKRKRATRGSS